MRHLYKLNIYITDNTFIGIPHLMDDRSLNVFSLGRLSIIVNSICLLDIMVTCSIAKITCVN